MTISQIVLVIAVAVCGAMVSGVFAYLYRESYGRESYRDEAQTNKKRLIISILISVLITILLSVFFVWYNHNTASGIRAYGEFRKDISNGVNRSITIVSDSGEIVYSYKGKIDIQDSDVFCLYFYDQNGISHIIHYSVTDRVFVEEIAEN